MEDTLSFLNGKPRRRQDYHFKRCSDWDVGRSAYCLRFDSGSKPHEIAFNEVKKLFHIMDQYFYNQGLFISDSQFHVSLFRSLRNLMVIYQDWRRHLDHYSRSHFNTTIEHLNEEQRAELFSKFTSILSTGLEEKELLSFYKARNLIYHTLTYLAFLPNRYCVLEKTGLLMTGKDGSLRILMFYWSCQKLFLQLLLSVKNNKFIHFCPAGNLPIRRIRIPQWLNT